MRALVHILYSFVQLLANMHVPMRVNKSKSPDSLNRVIDLGQYISNSFESSSIGFFGEITIFHAFIKVFICHLIELLLYYKVKIEHKWHITSINVNKLNNKPIIEGLCAKLCFAEQYLAHFGPFNF